MLTVVAVRPGVVDTDMQALLREKGPGAMPTDQASYYHEIKDRGQLKHPFIPARAIAWLSLQAPGSWSWEFLDYDDPRITAPAANLFGEPHEMLSL